MSPRSIQARLLFGRGLCAIAVVSCAARGIAAPEGAQAELSAKEAMSSVSESQLAEARNLFAKAESAASAGELAEALALMERSYALCQYPWLLFNLGLLHEKLGHCREAVEFYGKYLESVPDGTRRSEAEAYLASAPSCESPRIVHAEAAEQRAIASSAAVESPSAPVLSNSQGSPGSISRPALLSRDATATPYWTTQRTVGVTALSGGALAALAAVYFGWSAAEHDSDLAASSRAARALPPEERPSWSQGAEAIVQERDADRTRAIVSSGVAAALLGGGVLLFITSGSSADPQAPAASSLVQSFQIRISAHRAVADTTLAF